MESEQMKKLLQDKCVSPGEKRELELAHAAGISLLPYLEQGYDADQLAAIRYAIEEGIDIQPYLNILYRGACIKEIAIGLKEGLQVSAYADLKYSWRKMREIRLGMEENLDIRIYQDPIYSYWQMKEIRLGLKDGLDVSCYTSLMYTAREMHKRRILLKVRKDTPNLAGNWKIISEDDYDICISPDELKVYLNWHGEKGIEDEEAVLGLLKQHGIVYGIDRKAVRKLVQKNLQQSYHAENTDNVLVACGKAAKDGRNGYYDWKIPIKRRRTPKIDKDGCIDFDAIKWFHFVRKGETFAIYHFTEKAEDGVNIYGKTIPAKSGTEKDYLDGSGFSLLPDFQTYVADTDGHVYMKDKKVHVEAMLVCDSLRMADGDLQYDGNVHIKGNVEGPVAICVGGDLVIDGFVKNAEITCGGNLILKGGINNIAAPVQVNAKGCIISRFFEYTTVCAEDNIYFGVSLSSNLSSYGEIVSYGKNSGIIGGNSYAEKGFCLNQIGNEAGVVTCLQFGADDEIAIRKGEIWSKLEEVKHSLSQLAAARKELEKQKDTDEAMLVRIQDTISKKFDEMKAFNRKLEMINKREKRARKSKIIVQHQIYDNVEIQYENQKITAIPSCHVEVKYRNHLVIEQLYPKL